MSKALHTDHSVRIFRENERQLFDVFGPTIQFLTSPQEAGEQLCVLRGVIPPGAVVPIHSHAGVESFYLLSGQQDVLREEDGEFRWTVCSPGDFVEVPSGAKHAFRNHFSEPAVSLITTTAKLGHFFEEIGRPVLPSHHPEPPTPEDLQRFVEISRRYGYWLATPEENAAVGIKLF